MVCVLGLTGLGACGEDNGTTPVVLSFQDQALAGAQEFARLDGLPNSAFTAVPTAGTATYIGGAALSVDAPGGAFALLGDANVAVDFGNGTVAGVLSGFNGGVIVGPALFPAANDDYTGTITMSADDFGVLRPNNFDGRFAGTLTGAGNVIAVSGQYSADFKGTPIKGIVATSSAGAQGTVNGGPSSPVQLDVWAE